MSDPATAITVEHEGPLAIIVLDRPERLNAIDAAMRNALHLAMNRLIDDIDVRAILMTGAGRAFCAGADLTEMLESRAAPERPAGGDMLRDIFNPLVLRMMSAPKPIIAAVNGPAVGVGCSLALAADIVLACSSATFTFAFVRLGAVPDAGATWLLPRVIGQSRALATMLLGQEVDAETAAGWGLVHELFEDGTLQQAARNLALKLANGPTRAYAGIKALARSSAARDLAAQLDLEAEWQDRAFATADLDAGIASFAARVEPLFSGQ